MLKSRKKVISICATRTGAGKSQTTRYVCSLLRKMKKKFVVVRHPMPYGDLVAQQVQRFGNFEELAQYKCTLEECEEFEPHMKEGNVLYCGVDYAKILKKAEKEASIIIWDGGNNDLPFFKPDLHIVVADPHRPGHELLYYPSGANVLMADAIVINKENTAHKHGIDTIMENVRALNKKATIIHAASPVVVDEPAVIAGKRVVVVEDGPTLTHGEMRYGAGIIAAKKYRCRVVPAFKYAIGSIKETFEKYKHVRVVLPAMGYGSAQIKEMEKVINRMKADAVIIATPVDITRFMKLNKPTVKVSYSLKEKGTTLKRLIAKRFK